MTDESTPDSGPMIDRELAPEHGPNFWADLDMAMRGTAAQSGGPTQELRSGPGAHVPPVHSWANDATRELGAVPAAANNTTVVPLQTRQPRRMWPIAVAAALIAVVGLGVLVSQRATDPPTTTQVAAGATETAQVQALDGPVDDSSDPATSPEVDGDTAPTPAAADSDSQDAAGGGSQDAPGVGESGDVSTATEPGDSIGVAPTPVPAVPDFAHALGATNEPDYLPLDQGLPADATFLANWPERALTWYAVRDADTSCASANHSEIRYVNGSGLTQDVRDPQLRFSGEISHFTVRSEQSLAAWLVSCGDQIELYVANMEPTGRITDQTLAWFGEGSINTVLVQWSADEITLGTIEPGGAAFSVDYNIETGLLSRNGGPSRIMIEAGAPADRSLTPLAASPDAGLTYWAGKASPGTVSECIELFGSGQSDTIWLRQGEGQWQPAVAGDFPTGTVTAAAIEPDSLQIAFADVCDGHVGRVVIGDQLGDGRIGNVRQIDLTPYVPGFAAQLFWVDSDTLRIETNNSEFGVDTVRFDYRLADNLIVQLD